ncbi:hypothetical protein V6N12_008932 [Hibiscus sabdariffa]|uniref:NADH dehydrogenase subunit 5 n=1 Tax=Hibiscus sabdariffa TaxID=183260 RepID=A0ABR2C465_9ROSI
MALALLAALVLSPLYVGRKHETRYYEMKLSSGFVLPMVLAGLIIAIRTSSSSSSSMADGGRGWLSPSPDPTWVLGIGGVRRGDWLPPCLQDSMTFALRHLAGTMSSYEPTFAM